MSLTGQAPALPLLRGAAAAIWASIDGVSAANIPVVNEGILSVVIVSRIEERWLHNPQESLGHPANGYIASSVSSIPQLVTLNIKHLLSASPTYSLDSPRACLALLTRNWRECATCIDTCRWLVKISLLSTIGSVWFVLLRVALATWGILRRASVTVTEVVSSLNVSVTFKMAIRKKNGSPFYFEHFK